ncbi:MAG: UDP-N-acetylmuramoyl-tripeptide--D-alanyl-D-alanine ligase [Chloroflexi bacterium]|nr:UDP-N-acetylmuramoyl-tripeptide--D-alanyl-D-alanine ligase [Chloroflexota bacterium]
MARQRSKKRTGRVLTLADLIEGLGGGRLAGLEMPITPILDSRKAGPGAVFLAFRGETADGHAFVGDALARGAVAAVVDAGAPLGGDLSGATVLDLTDAALPQHTVSAPVILKVPAVLQGLQRAAAFWRQQFDVRVIGITGSVGKTTTKEVTARVLQQRYRVLHSTGSYNNEIGLPLTLLQLTAEHDLVVLEMGMYVRGDIRSLAEIARPQIGILTNVEPVHAERAGSLENIALGKRELVEALPPAPEGVAILNDDDPFVRAMAEATRARVFTYGLDPAAHLWADEVESLGLEGIRARLHYGSEAVYVRAPLLGRHSVHTLLRAAAAGLILGLSWQEIIEGLQTPGAQLRLVSTPGPQETLVLDDTYNSSPPSALAALNLLADLEGRKIAVLGDMLELGAYEEEGHLKVGCRAADVAAHLVTVGPRGALMARGARLCGMPPERVHEAATNAEALAWLLEVLEPHDVILVKGSRAMRMEEIVSALSRAAKG